MNSAPTSQLCSPVRTKTQTQDLSFASPFPWLSSPLADLAMSPESALSFSLSSPPRPLNSTHPSFLNFSTSFGTTHSTGLADLLSATFSPSMFSPEVTKREVVASSASSALLPFFGDISSPGVFQDDDNVRESALSAQQSQEQLFGDEHSQDFHNVIVRLNARTNGRHSTHDNSSGAVVESNLKSTSKRKQLRLKQTALDNLAANTSDESPVLIFDSKRDKRSSSGSAAALMGLGSKRDRKKPLALTPPGSSLLVDASTHSPVSTRSKEQLESRTTDERSLSSSFASQHSLNSGVSSFGVKSLQLSARTSCNCKKSKCLKLYCDCFAALNYCDSTRCNCAQCFNVSAHESSRSEAIRLTKERNALAFQTKISDGANLHVTGCHCKNSHCLKKYCECFNGGALCGANCKCQSCQNFAGSSELARTRESSPRTAPAAVVSNTTQESLAPSKKRRESPNSIVWSPQTAGSVSTELVAYDSKEVVKSHYTLRGKAVASTPQSSTAPSLHQSTPAPVHCESTSPSVRATKKPRIVRFVEQQKPKEDTYPFFGPHLPEQPKRIALLVLDCLSNQDMFNMSLVNGIWCDATRDDALWE